MTGFTQEKLTKLENAIAEGALEIEYEGKKVKYRNLDEMIRIRDMIKSSLSPVDAGSSIATTVGIYRSGL